MNTMQAKMPSWVEAVGITSSAWTSNGPAAQRNRAPAVSVLSADEAACFMRVVAESAHIRRHEDLYRWLSGDVQQLLPHEILFSAWGDFSTWNLKLDLVSGLPGVRTAALAQCPLEPLLREVYGRWTDGGRKPLFLKAGETRAARNACPCAMHVALRGMRSLLVHGLADKRSEHESLFIAFTSGGFTKGRSLAGFLSSVEPLLAQIDGAFRKVTPYPLREPRIGAAHANVLDLSPREIDVLEAICRGKTNLDIAAALAISPFTVKNHVQRIFRKIGVTNRTQAAARYAEALLHAAVSSVERAQEALQEAR
jgi:transcriptional regulator EpsA